MARRAHTSGAAPKKSVRLEVSTSPSLTAVRVPSLRMSCGAKREVMAIPLGYAAKMSPLKLAEMSSWEETGVKKAERKVAMPVLGGGCQPSMRAPNRRCLCGDQSEGVSRRLCAMAMGKRTVSAEEDRVAKEEQPPTALFNRRPIVRCQRLLKPSERRIHGWKAPGFSAFL